MSDSICSSSSARGIALPLLSTVAVVALALGCAPRAMRGGEGTANPDLDNPALSVTLDREDINYLVSDYLKTLEGSRFWQQDIVGTGDRPLVAIFPVVNSTSQHIDDQMLTLLSSIETALVNTGEVRVVARSDQQALIQEIGVQNSAAFDQSTAQRVGRQLGARYYFTGKITSVDERLQKVRRVQYSLFLRVLEVETGLIEFQNEVTRSKQVER
jgi:PBP1b-binding outer membrane lipoprotein LpoB